MEGPIDLVLRVLSGDLEAFDELYRSHAGAVRAVVRRQAHSAEQVSDLVQETFVRALEGLPNLRDPERFKAWLLAIARNVTADECRRPSEVPREQPDDRRDQADGPEDEAETAELVSLVRGCVRGLSRREALVIHMTGYLGFSSSDVAAALGVSPGNAKVLAHRARRRLRDALLLEMLVRRSAIACDRFRELLAEEGEVAAGLHLRGCPFCLGRAEDEVTGFSQGSFATPDPVVAVPSGIEPAV